MPRADDIELELPEVARRLHHSPRWLREVLDFDRKHRSPPRLQFHHRIGRTLLWTEAAYQQLRAEIIALGKDLLRATRPASPLSRAPATGISMAPSALE